MNFIDKVLIALGIFLFLFIGFMCLTFWQFQAVPDTLIIGVLGAGGLETIATAFITIKKWKKHE